MSNSESVRAAEAEILAAFQRFDVNRDGRISEAEFVAILTRETSQRASLAPDQAKQLFAKADLDRAGHVEYKKFAAAWATHLAASAETQSLLTHPEATGLAAPKGTDAPRADAVGAATSRAALQFEQHTPMLVMPLRNLAVRELGPSTARHLSAGYPSRLWRLRELRRHAKVWRVRPAEEGLHTEGRQRQQGCCASTWAVQPRKHFGVQAPHRKGRSVDPFTTI